MFILAGDIGGTHTRLLLAEFRASQKQPYILKQADYLSANYQSLFEIIQRFFTEYAINSATIKAACFAAAGPIVNGAVQLTNLPWYVDRKELQQALQIPTVELINDFQAIALGIELLSEADLFILQAGQENSAAPRAVMGAGTGLGVATLVPVKDRFEIIASEGGHVDFAPVDDTQMELLNYLRRKYYRVSNERILAGSGIVNIYHFVRDNPLYNEHENMQLRQELQNATDQAALISEYALQKQDPMALRAFDIFIRAYGAAAGNLALTVLPFGGLYLVGGIAPKLHHLLADGRFLKMFTDKSRMSELLKQIPVKIVLNTQVGQMGAALYVRDLQ